MTATIEQRSQEDYVGEYVALFTIDMTPRGGGIIYWTPSRPSVTKPIIWNGNTYLSVDIEATGFERTSSGTMPRPQLAASNADDVVGALLLAYGDLLGCIVTRTQTLYEFLDDQPGADPEQHWPIDVYRVERKAAINKHGAILELSTALDNGAAKLPRGIVTRNYCPFMYRRWVDGAFDYTNATCPYTGASCFDRQGQSVAAGWLDSCGKRLADCKLRYGALSELPYGGFPGAARS